MVDSRMFTRPRRTAVKRRPKGHATGLNVQARSANVALPRAIPLTSRYTPIVRRLLLLLCFIQPPSQRTYKRYGGSTSETETGQQVIDLVLIGNDVRLAGRTGLRAVKQRIGFLALLFGNVIDQNLDEFLLDGADHAQHARDYLACKVLEILRHDDFQEKIKRLLGIGWNVLQHAACVIHELTGLGQLDRMIKPGLPARVQFAGTLLHGFLQGLNGLGGIQDAVGSLL